jgi:hypothetical protein
VGAGWQVVAAIPRGGSCRRDVGGSSNGDAAYPEEPAVVNRERGNVTGRDAGSVPDARPDFDREHRPDIAQRASLAGLRAIQMKAATPSTQPVHDAAARGIASPTIALPYG